jgi:hypothetical protein
MKHKLALVSLGAALALAAAAAGAQAAPTGNLGGVRAADGSTLTQPVHGDYRYRSWSRRNSWDDDYGRRGHNRWWRHRRHHHDHDRWSWDGDRDRHHHHHHHRDRDRRW